MRDYKKMFYNKTAEWAYFGIKKFKVVHVKRVLAKQP